ncbi:hypothetical protein EVJ32_05145 [Exiguobacterium sp. SH5S4]|uniref:peptidoglycan DD-metalloendopeptidase family protein n=1 Tax=Exiguobacterium sp. SH5S4 TaxID=2510961 RepID=UPI0010405A26|nr:peptidoglycan DD-metalloendopeptidase family protein [Exiguobacterium sp. SH5S4]TCI26764.1 hypothetical protein EVJ32_05145 [Exiguobacterium sp. SH5S4]
MNSLKTIFSRVTMSGSVSSLKDVGIEVFEEDGTTRAYARILEDLSGKWNNLTNAQQQNLAVQLAGRFQISRFLGLMQNYDVAVKATNTSINSQGSAMQENARYLESAQAKVNKLKVAWEELALSAGNTVFVDMITTVTNDLRYMVNSINALISLDFSKGNLLAGFTMLAGVTGGLTTLMNGGVRNAVFDEKPLAAFREKLQGVTSSYQDATAAVVKSRNENQKVVPINGNVATSLDKVKGAAHATAGGFRIAGTAVKGFMVTTMAAIGTSLVIGAGIAAATVAIGALISAFTKQRAEVAKAKQEQKELVKAYSDNSDTIDMLAERYENLQANTNRSAEETELMYSTAKSLGGYLPELVTHVDELGRTHLSTSVSAQEYIKSLKEMQQLEAMKKSDKNEDSLVDNAEQLEKANKDYEKYLNKKKMTDEEYARDMEMAQGAITDSAIYSAGADDVGKARERDKRGELAAERLLKQSQMERIKLTRDQITLSIQSSDEYANLAGEQQKLVDSLVTNIDQDIVDKALKNAVDENGEFNVDKLLVEIEKVKMDILDISNILTDMPSFDETLFKSASGNKQMEEATKFINTYAQKIVELENEQKRILGAANVATDSGLTGSYLAQYQALEQAKTDVANSGRQIIQVASEEGHAINTATAAIVMQNAKMEETQSAAYDALAGVSDLTEGNENLGESAETAATGIGMLEEALGYQKDALRDVVGTVDAYNDVLHKSAEGHQFTASEMMGLIDKYPELIDAFDVSNGMVTVNTGLIEELRETQRLQFEEKLKQATAQRLQDEFTARFSAELTADRIAGITSIAEAEKALVLVKQETAKQIADIENKMNSIDPDDPNYGRQMYAGDMIGRLTADLSSTDEFINGMKKSEENARKIVATVTTSTQDLYNANKAAEEANKDSSKSEKNKQDTISRSTYLTNKYTEAIDKATLAVQKQSAFKNKYANGSKAYIKALESEIKAMDKQKKSVTDYIKALQDANKSKQVIASTGVQTSTQEVVTDANGNIVARGGTTNSYDVAYNGSNSSATGGFQKTGTRSLSGWSGAKISSSYGSMRTINGKTWQHEGIDIANKRGTPLESNVNGTVIHAGGANKSLGIPSEYGNNVVIQDTSGIFHIYGHLDKIEAKKGAKVGVGQRIGTVGNTGNSTGPHVHYEQRSSMGKWNTNLLNPTVAARQAVYSKRNTYGYSSSASSSISKASTSSSSFNKVSSGVGQGAFKGQEHLFNKYGEKYGVDPALAMAIAMFETGNGTSNGVKNYNNPGGLMSPSSNWTKQTVFKSLDEGISAMISNLSRNYITKGLTSIAEIQKKYAPNGAGNDPTGLNAHWKNGVTSMYTKVSQGKSPSTSAASVSSTQVDQEKKIADQTKAQAEKAQNLAEQKAEEIRQIEELNKIEDSRQQIILDYLNARANTYKSMYDRYGKDEELVRANMETTVEYTRQSLALYEKLQNNARLQRRAVELEIIQMEKDRKGAYYKQLSLSRQAEFTARLDDLRWVLKQEIQEERQAAMEIARERTEIRNKLYENQMRDLKKNQDFFQRQLAIMDGESNTDLVKKYVTTVEQEKTERKLWDIKKRQLEAERAILSEVRKKYGASSKEYEQQLEFVKRYSEELLSLEDSVNSLNSAQKDMLGGFSDSMIETIREALEAQRDAEIKSIEKIQQEREKAIQRERNVRQNAHEKTMKELDKEREKMNDFFDERIKRLDEQNDERSHQKQMDEYSEREQEIRSSINRISMDDSFEAKAKRKELMKELQTLQEEREEYLYQRDFEKQKEAIDKERELYEKNLDDKQKVEDENYEKFEEDMDRREEAESALFDKMLEDLNKYYDDVLNDERKWNEIREQAMKGNFDEVKRMANEMLIDTSKGFRTMYDNLGKTYQDVLKDLSYLYDDTEYETIALADTISKALGDIVHTSQSSFDSLGQVLQTNYIDKLKEALDLLSQLTGKDFDTDYKNPSSGDDLSQEAPVTGLSMYAAQTGSAKPVSVRADANGSSKVIGSLVDGKGYEVLEQTGTHSKVKLSNGQTGWVSNSELSTSKQSNSWGVAMSHTRASELNQASAPINELLKQYSVTAKAHNARVDSISYDSGKRVYDDMVTDSTNRIKSKQQSALQKYYSAYESASTNEDRNKALDEYVKSLSDMQSEIIRAKREFDALYESLKGSTTIDKNAKTSSNAALYANPYISVEGIMTSIPKGTSIKILRDRGLMYEVQYGDKTGYVNKNFVGSFASGGMYTGEFNGGMPAILHKKELVLNQEQTKNMLKTVEFTDRLISPLRSLINKMQSVKGSSAPTVHIENINNDFSNNEIKDGKEASDDFMKRTMNLINNKYGKR